MQDKFYSQQYPENRRIPDFSISSSATYLPLTFRSNQMMSDLLSFVDQEIGVTKDENNPNLRFLLEKMLYSFRPDFLQPPFTPQKEKLFDEIIDFIEKLFNYKQDKVIKNYLFVSLQVDESGQLTYVQNEEKERMWQLFDLFSIPFKRQWRNSLKAYRFIFSSIFRHGAVYLEAYYPSSESLSLKMAGKKFRLVDYQSAQRFLPIRSNTDYDFRFPNAGRLEGLKSYDDYIGKSQKYDEDLSYDTIFTYDTPFQFIMGKSIALELTLDRLLLHHNFFGEHECLCDLVFLEYIEREVERTKRVNEKISVGAQIALVTTDLGVYTFGLQEYTIPNIKAKFQVILSGWLSDKEITHVRLGTGKNESLFRSALSLTEIPVYTEVESGQSAGAYYHYPYIDPVNPPISEVPENSEIFPNLINPVLMTSVEEFERSTNVYGFQAISVMVHKNVVKNRRIPVVFNYLNEDGQPSPNVIDLQKEFITQGTLEFSIENPSSQELTLYDPQTKTEYALDPFWNYEENYKSRIHVRQLFNFDSLRWEYVVDYQVFAFHLVDPIIHSTQRSYISLPVERLFEEYQQKGGTIPTLEEYLITYFGMFLSSDHIQLDARKGKLVIGVRTKETKGKVCEFNFESNNLKDYASFDKNSGVVAITEMGCFNKKDELVAYATFPPVIYDTDRHHLSFDLFIKQGMYEVSQFQNNNF